MELVVFIIYNFLTLTKLILLYCILVIQYNKIGNYYYQTEYFESTESFNMSVYIIGIITIINFYHSNIIYKHKLYCAYNIYCRLTLLNIYLIHCFIKSSSLCYLCEYSKHTQSPLSDHNTKHTGENLLSDHAYNFICNFSSYLNKIGKIFTNKYIFTKLYATHILEISLIIIEYVSLNNLRDDCVYRNSHLGNHTGEKPFTCTICCIIYDYCIYSNETENVTAHKYIYIYLLFRNYYKFIVIILEKLFIIIIGTVFQKFIMEPCGTKGKSYLLNLKWR